MLVVFKAFEIKETGGSEQLRNNIRIPEFVAYEQLE